MTSIELMAENSKEMVELLKGMEGANNESVHLLRKKINLHDVRPDPVQTGAGLGSAQTPDEKRKKEPYQKLIDDLRANALWLSDDMPVPDDLRDNILKAVKLLELERSSRMIIKAMLEIESERTAEILK